MAYSECKCEHFSCEPGLPNGNNRFRFVKENNVICSQIKLDGIEYRGGPTKNDIDHCEMKTRFDYTDKKGFHEKRA